MQIIQEAGKNEKGDFVMERDASRYRFGALTFCLTAAFFVVLNPTLNSTLAYLGLIQAPFLLNDIAIGLVGAFSLCCALCRINRDRKVDAFLICVGLLFLVVLCSSMVFSGSEAAGVLSLGGKYPFSSGHVFFLDWIPALSAVLLVFAFHGSHQSELIWGVLVACTIYTLLNMKLLIEQAQYFTAIDNLFTGYRNSLFRIIIPSYVCALLVFLKNRGSWIILPIVFYIVGLIQVIGAYSATSVCAMILMGILTPTLLWKGLRRYLNALSYGIGYGVLFLSMVLFRVQDMFGSLIQSLFHRNATLTGRTLIWDQVFQSLQGCHLFMGYGVGYMYQTIRVNGAVYKHTHNELLHILMTGGLLALAMYVAVFVLSIRRLYLRKESSVAVALSIGLAGLLLISLTEVVFSPGLFFLLAAAYYWLPVSQESDLGGKAVCRTASDGANGK